VKLPLYRTDPAHTTRYLFFTGKGGVGKTSLSCAAALKLAESGNPVLLVSTDPASNLDEVLTRSTRLPDSASFNAAAQESDVLPTPPLPVKNR
jgi:anion-transporting  ArsA/GET3 family ATPase